MRAFAATGLSALAGFWAAVAVDWWVLIPDRIERAEARERSANVRLHQAEWDVRRAQLYETLMINRVVMLEEAMAKQLNCPPRPATSQGRDTGERIPKQNLPVE